MKQMVQAFNFTRKPGSEQVQSQHTHGTIFRCSTFFGAFSLAYINLIRFRVLTYDSHNQAMSIHPL